MEKSYATAEDYTALKKGEKTKEELLEEKRQREAQEKADSVSVRDFIIGVTQETLDVPVMSGDGAIRNIAIRTRMSKKDQDRYSMLFKKWNRALQGDDDVDFEDDETVEIIARFLADITIDDSLDYDFWIAGEYDATVATDIMTAYLTEPLKRKGRIQKFRNQ